MKNLLAFLSLCLLFLITSAQERKINITPQRQSNSSIDFNYEKTDPGTYTLVFSFSEYTNTDRPQEIYSVSDSRGAVFSLRPKNPGQGIGYRYNYRYIRGKLKPKVNKDFCYLLPYAPGIECEVVEAGFANEHYFGAKKPDDWKSYFFYTKNEETVTAIRKGIVVEIVDQYEDVKNVEYTTQKNTVIIEHEDGTLVRYQGFKKGSLKVKPGETVFPNSPLGQNTSYTANRFGVSVFIYYLSSVNFESLRGQSLTTPKSLYSIVTPNFLTGDASCIILETRKTYTSFSNEVIITKEMNKKEIKKYKER
ncbi:MAG: hypothetical protein QM594_13215 [Niabella sp.]